MTNLNSTLKSRDITLSTKVLLVKAMVFPVVMYGCESWTIKKGECWRIYAFELWCWRRLLRVPWTARRSNQSILKEISPECSLEGLMLSWNSNTVATWCEELTLWKRPWCWERLKVGEGDDRGWDSWMASLTQWTWVWVNSGSWWWTGRPGTLQSTGSQRLGHDWTELNWIKYTIVQFTGPNIPGSYATLFFTASDFTFTTKHIHNWASFLLWASCFILSGAFHNCPPLFTSSILDIFWPRGSFSMSYIFDFTYCSRFFHSNNTGVVCHSLL